MATLFREQRVFWRQFRQQFHTTGAVLPSGRFLGRALASFVGQAPGQRVLEVGPGTGAVTSHIVRRLGAEDRFDLVELNEAFVQVLNERFEREGPFRAVADRSRVLHQRVEALAGGEPYDVIVSGLPLNNFSLSDVEHIIGVITRLLRPGGTLSFFEYVAIRSVKAMVSKPAERQRLRAIGQTLDRLLLSREIRRDCVWPNVPPAWVHHVRFSLPDPGQSAASNVS